MMQLVGRKKVNFVTNDGKRVDGVKLHMLVLDSSVEGMACDTPFISVDSPAYQRACDVPLGEVMVEYDRKGKIVAIIGK